MHRLGLKTRWPHTASFAIRTPARATRMRKPRACAKQMGTTNLVRKSVWPHRVLIDHVHGIRWHHWSNWCGPWEKGTRLNQSFGPRAVLPSLGPWNAKWLSGWFPNDVWTGLHFEQPRLSTHICVFYFFQDQPQKAGLLFHGPRPCVYHTALFQDGLWVRHCQLCRQSILKVFVYRPFWHTSSVNAP